MTDNPRAFPSGAIDDKYGGMTLLDWYAGQALVGILATGAGEDDCQELRRIIARDAFDYADAMLAERERQP